LKEDDVKPLKYPTLDEDLEARKEAENYPWLSDFLAERY
jgi:hypothetical protein